MKKALMVYVAAGMALAGVVIMASAGSATVQPDDFVLRPTGVLYATISCSQAHAPAGHCNLKDGRHKIITAKRPPRPQGSVIWYWDAYEGGGKRFYAPAPGDAWKPVKN